MAYDNNAVPGQQSTQESSNPVISTLSAAIQHQNDVVAQAAKTLQGTSQVLATHNPQPVAPAPKVNFLANASVNNVANERPETREGARNKAIGQIAGQAGSLVGAYMKKQEQKKTQALAIDIHRSLELQQGLDEAKGVLQQDPNNEEAKAALQKNQTLMDALLSGKNGKEIAKSYGVTFGAEAKDMSPEKKKDSMHYQAMQQAMKQANQDKEAKNKAVAPGGTNPDGSPNMGAPARPNVSVRPDTKLEQFESQLPARITANPAYQQAKANYDEAAKRADGLTKTYATLSGKMYASDTLSKDTDKKVAGAEQVAGTLNSGRQTIEGEKEKAAIGLEKQKHEEKLSEIAARGAEARKTVKVAKTPGDMEKAAMLYFTQSSDDVRKYSDQLKDLAKQQSILKAKDADTKDIDRQVKNTQDYLKAAQEQKSESLGLMMGDPDAAAMMQLMGDDGDTDKEDPK
jgi:hypothetical protein